MRTRENKQADSFLYTGFEFKGKTYKPITAQTLLILERVQSPFYTGEDSGIQGLLDYLYVTGSPIKETLKASKDLDEWELAVAEFAEILSANDLTELGKLISQETETVQAALVEAKPEKSSEKK